MDRLEACIDRLRMLAEQSDNPNFIVVTRRRINEFVNTEIPGGRASIERLAQAIEAAAEKRQGEDWTVAKEYVCSLLQRPGAT